VGAARLAAGAAAPSAAVPHRLQRGNAPGRLALSDAKMKSLGAFARQVDPNVPSALGVQWPTRPSRPAFDATPAQKVITVE